MVESQSEENNQIPPDSKTYQKPKTKTSILKPKKRSITFADDLIENERSLKEIQIEPDYRKDSGRSEMVKYLEKMPGVTTRQMLYRESLYTSIHMLGKPTFKYPASKSELTVYSHIVFSADEKDQLDNMHQVLGEPFPLTVVNTRVRRGENLEGRDVSGLSDPYCLVSIETVESLDPKEWDKITIGSPFKPTLPQKERLYPIAEERDNQIYDQVASFAKTSIQIQTVNPVWDQQFQCLALRPSVDALTVEVWDHDEKQSVLEDLKKGKGKSGWFQGIREIKESFTGKRDDFLGKVTLAVADIPVEGEEKWFALSGKRRQNKTPKGKILLQIWLVHAYRHGRHNEDYPHPKVILEHLWDHILDYEGGKSEVDWKGEIPPAATSLLFQYGLQNGLSEVTQAVIRWKSYSKQPLSVDGLERRLNELKLALEKNRLFGKPDGDLEDVENAMSRFIANQILPIFQNHMNEHQERVSDAVKALTNARGVLKKLGSVKKVKEIDWLVVASLRMAVLWWYEEKYKELAIINHNSTCSELIDALVLVINEVNAAIREGIWKWSPVFWMDGTIDYMPIIYDEFQKMIVHDVEEHVWACIGTFDNVKLKRMIERPEDQQKALSRALFNLYYLTQTFVNFQDEIFKYERPKYEDLNSYYDWFRPVLVLWLGYAFSRTVQIITNAITVDKVAMENNLVKTSSSALDTATSFHQLIQFWKELNWPNIPDSFAILVFIFDAIGCIAKYYARLKRCKLDKEGYFDTLDRFDISERLCTVLNNIEYVKLAMLGMPIDINLEKLMEALENEMGSEVGKAQRGKIESIINLYLGEIEAQFGKIFAGIGNRIRPEIRDALKETMKLVNPETDTSAILVPLLAYLEENFVTLQKFLLELNFIRMLRVFWNVTCQEIYWATKAALHDAKKEEVEDIMKIGTFFPILVGYFEGGGSGLNETEINTDDFRNAKKFADSLMTDTKILIKEYYALRANEQKEVGKSKGKLGEIMVRVAYWQGKLCAEIHSAKNLTPLDPNINYWSFCKKEEARSDPQVKVEIAPKFHFPEAEVFTSSVQWKTLNPVFDEKFCWDVTEDQCREKSSTVIFTVRDYDILTGNDFLGEAFVPLEQIPGIAPPGKAIPQPLNLNLLEVNPNNYVLVILKYRRWDSEAIDFVSEQLTHRVEVDSQDKKSFIDSIFFTKSQSSSNSKRKSLSKNQSLIPASTS